MDTGELARAGSRLQHACQVLEVVREQLMACWDGRRGSAAYGDVLAALGELQEIAERARDHTLVAYALVVIPVGHKVVAVSRVRKAYRAVASTAEGAEDALDALWQAGADTRALGDVCLALGEAAMLIARNAGPLVSGSDSRAPVRPASRLAKCAQAAARERTPVGLHPARICIRDRKSGTCSPACLCAAM